MKISRKTLSLLLVAFTLIFSACNNSGSGEGEGTNDPTAEADVRLSCELGDIYIKLYDETPKHKENFLKLAKEGYYNGTTWHRVIQMFMVQGGDPNTKEGSSGPAGQGGPGYTVPAEINPKFYHKAGAVAAARLPDNMNPNWESSGSQFYIVHGKLWTDKELDLIENQVNGLLDMRARQSFDAKPENKWIEEIDLYKLQEEDSVKFDSVKAIIDRDYSKHRENHPQLKFTPEQRTLYKTEGGYPPLDMQYTIFGEVVKGMDVVNQIAAQPTGAMDKPIRDIPITVEVLE